MLIRQSSWRVVSLGLLLLIVANLTRWYAQRTEWEPDAMDATLGLLFGLAIGVTLLGLWMGRRSQHIAR